MISNEINDICMRWDYEALAKRYRPYNRFEVEREERRAKGEIIIEEGGKNESFLIRVCHSGDKSKDF